MIELAAVEIAEAVGGTLVAPTDWVPVPITGPVVLDSRLAAAGGLFVAVTGERVDGHDFAQQAILAGCVLVLAERSLPGVAKVVVADSTRALGLLAREVLRRLPHIRVIGLTGSSGKTSTKDLIAGLLELLGPTVAPAGSFNNELGLPLTVLTATAQTRFLVLELGARGIGHVRMLAELAPPQVAVVLNVGSAHLGEFGSREAIAQAKGELVEALAPDGLAILNADDPMVMAMRDRTLAQVVTFGRSPTAQVRAEQVEIVGGRASFRLVTREGSAHVELGLLGDFQVSNALAAAAVALHEGMTVPAIAAGLSQAQPRSRWRMEVTERADGVTVINDAYNANPESMRAALKTLVEVGRGRRTWAVLGEMRELGADSVAEHDAIGRLAVRLDVNRLIVVGAAARTMFLGAGLEGSWGNEAMAVDDISGALAILTAELASGDVVLVKASRAVGLEQIAEALARKNQEKPA